MSADVNSEEDRLWFVVVGKIFQSKEEATEYAEGLDEILDEYDYRGDVYFDESK